jgi:aminoglycoside phosphotransferase (APT) family kinase protein
MAVGSNRETRLVSRVTAHILQGSSVEVTPLVGKGSVNKVFIAEGAGHKVVVRMSDRDGALDEYEKEVWCIERAAARGVPVPSVMTLGLCEGHAYLIESFIDGDEGRDSRAPGPGVWRELGRYAGLIHSIGVQGFGLKLSDITRGDARNSWLRYLEYNIESLNADDPLLRLKVLTRLQAQVIRGAFADMRGREFTFGLNHGDLSLKNTIVDASGRVTLLDWGSAEASLVPHHDLIQLLKMNMLEGDPDDEALRAFLDGYGISTAAYERLAWELETLLVLRAFDKLRWALDWKAEELDGFVSHAREAVGRYLSRY